MPEPINATEWSTPNHQPSYEQLAKVQQRLPVGLIGTPREDLSVCYADETVSDVLGRNTESFDFWPVASRGKSQIIGLLRLDASVDSATLVASAMEPLSERNLIGADAGIIEFIGQADTSPCRLVVAGGRIAGLVTLSDLQRLPVRVAFFGMVTHLEMAMAAAIRRVAPAQSDWIAHLTTKRRRRVLGKITAAKRKDSFVEPLLYTEFADKRDILGKSLRFPSAGLGRRKTFDSDLKAIEALRNKVAHANHYAATKSDAAGLAAVVQKAERLIHGLEALHA